MEKEKQTSQSSLGLQCLFSCFSAKSKNKDMVAEKKKRLGGSQRRTRRSHECSNPPLLPSFTLLFLVLFSSLSLFLSLSLSLARSLALQMNQ